MGGHLQSANMELLYHSIQLESQAIRRQRLIRKKVRCPELYETTAYSRLSHLPPHRLATTGFIERSQYFFM